MNGTDITSKILLALSAVEELSIRKKESLLNAVDEPSVLGGKSAKALISKILGEQAQEFERNIIRVDDLIADLAKRGMGYTTYLDDEYPQRLREIDGAPIVLFTQGDASLLSSDSIAVIGTRKPSRYGVKIAESFTREFARAGLTVVSGFARGIDSIAHKACVDSQSPTIAVFACGLDVCYPAENRGLRDSILQNGGLIVSEYPLGTKPLQYHFPERNRIISGISRALFLPEAAKRSGSLITLRLAVEQGRDIFVTPSNIYAEEGEGSNAVLREMPHALVISPDDVLDGMRVCREEKKEQTIELDFVETTIINALKDSELHFEELIEITDLNVNALNNVLFNLEMKGLIEQTSGNYYVLS